MDIYHYDENNLYLGQSVARKDPEDGLDLIPRNATSLRPPLANANEIPRWNGISWDIFPDFRGVQYWMPDGTSHIITDAGITQPPEALDYDPTATPAAVLEASRRVKADEIKQEIVRRIGLVTGAFDTFAEIQVLAALWPALQTANFGPAMDQARQIYIYGRTRLNQLQSATQSQVDGYDPVTDAGWPF